MPEHHHQPHPARTAFAPGFPAPRRASAWIIGTILVGLLASGCSSSGGTASSGTESATARATTSASQPSAGASSSPSSQPVSPVPASGSSGQTAPGDSSPTGSSAPSSPGASAAPRSPDASVPPNENPASRVAQNASWAQGSAPVRPVSVGGVAVFDAPALWKISPAGTGEVSVASTQGRAKGSIRALKEGAGGRPPAAATGQGTTVRLEDRPSYISGVPIRITALSPADGSAPFVLFDLAGQGRGGVILAEMTAELPAAQARLGEAELKEKAQAYVNSPEGAAVVKMLTSARTLVQPAEGQNQVQRTRFQGGTLQAPRGWALSESEGVLSFISEDNSASGFITTSAGGGQGGGGGFDSTALQVAEVPLPGSGDQATAAVLKPKDGTAPYMVVTTHNADGTVNSTTRVILRGVTADSGDATLTRAGQQYLGSASGQALLTFLGSVRQG